MGRKVKVKAGGRTLTALVAASFCGPCQAEEIQAQSAASTRRQYGPGQNFAIGDPPPTTPVAPTDPTQPQPAVPAEPPAPAPGDAPPPPEDDDPTIARWSGVIAIEGQLTGDARMIEDGALFWDDLLPAPLRWDIEDDGAHAGAVVTGLCETLERRPGGIIWGTGFIDLIGDNGWESARLMDRGMLRGVSIDPDTVDYEIRVAGELYDEVMGEPTLWVDLNTGQVTDADGNPVDPPEPVAPPRDAEGRVVVHSVKNDEEVMVVTSARIRAMTLVDTPAFVGAKISLDKPLGPRPEPLEEVEEPMLMPLYASGRHSLVAAAAAAVPVRPPAAWFTDPGLNGPTPLTYTDDGRVYGHIALWDTCHLGYESCVPPPRSATNYSWFRTGILLADDGTEVTVGQITFDTGHAGRDASAMAAVAHYDHTGRTGADVAAGEDRWGVWVAGAQRPNLTPVQVRALRASAPSGDWRSVGGNLELCAILGVNMPGFPVPRGLVASGRPVSLLLPAPTAEQLAKRTRPAPAGPVVIDSTLSAEDRTVLKQLIADGRAVQEKRSAAARTMARSIEAGELARTVLT